MLRSDLCDFSNAYIITEGTITAEPNANRNNNGHNNPFVFKNNASFNWTSKINGVINDTGKGLDVVISMHNLIEYSKNYKKNNIKFVELLQRRTR